MSQQINFQQLITLAFDPSSSNGIVNLKYLEALLHGLVYKMAIENVKIELRGGEFSDADELINALLGQKANIDVAEYETQKNDLTGKYDKKRQIKKGDVEVDRVMVLRDTKIMCCDEEMERQRAGCDYNESRKSQNRTPEMNDCLEHVLQNCEDSCLSQETSRTQSQVFSEYSECQSNVATTIQSSPCPSSAIIADVDTRLLACVQEMTVEIDQIKCQLKKTQNCLTRICENSKLMTASDDETDAKFDEIMKLFDDYEKRIGRNCADICACQKMIEDNVQRIDAIYEEIETLFKTKADKNEMMEKLKTKADKCELERKVDVEAFDQFKCEINETISCINEQLNSISHELDARVKQICQCLNTKMDQDAFSQFARCVEDRVKQISMETKKWMSIKKREVCPFATTPYVQNLQCGACNQPVVMKGEENCLPLLPAFSRIVWNCQSKTSHCERTGGRHTITTAEDRCPRQTRFSQQFSSRVNATQVCKGGPSDLDFPQTCYSSMNEKTSEINSGDNNQ